MSKTWKIGIVKDTSEPMLGLHALHTAYRGLPDVDVVAHVDSNPEDDSCFEDVPLTEDRVIPDAAPLEYSLGGQKDIPRVKMFLQSNRFAVWDLMRAIEENRQPVSNVYNARLALEMIYGIYASHLSRGVVSFPLTDRAHPLGE